ncbi:Vitamin B12 import ATP-binding protein BtuD [compost metagenome]
MLLGRHRALGWKVGEGLLKAAGQILCRFALVDFADRKMHTLSGGQQQLVLLAQRLLANPNLLLLDEATSALDIKHQLEVMRLLGEYVSETGRLVLLAVHDLNLASRYSDTIMLLHRGKLWGVGPFEVAVTPEALRAVYGIDAEFITSVTGGTVLVPRLPTDCQSPLVN